MNALMRRVYRDVSWLAVLLPAVATAQIDPVKRDLIQFGYNQPTEGKAPLAAYAYYYHNQPDFLRTNLTLRLALPLGVMVFSLLAMAWWVGRHPHQGQTGEVPLQNPFHLKRAIAWAQEIIAQAMGMPR